MLRVAVTGGTGFIGRRVVRELLTAGATPLLLVRPGSGARARSVVTGAAEVEASSVNVLEVDFDDPPADLFERAGRPEALVHLAWSNLHDSMAAVHLSEELPRHRGVAAALIRPGLRRVVATGTSAEYGVVHGPVSENTPVAPTTDYGRAKARLHAELAELCVAAGSTLVWARLFPLLGEDQPEHELLGRLRTAVEQGKSTFDMSLGEQLRDYLDVDVAGRLVAELVLDEHADGVYNVCSGQPISIRRLAEEWRERTRSDIALRFGHRPSPTHESMAFWGDRTRLDGLLQRRDQPAG